MDSKKNIVIKVSGQKREILDIKMSLFNSTKEEEKYCNEINKCVIKPDGNWTLANIFPAYPSDYPDCLSLSYDIFVREYLYPYYSEGIFYYTIMRLENNDIQSIIKKIDLDIIQEALIAYFPVDDVENKINGHDQNILRKMFENMSNIKSMKIKENLIKRSKKIEKGEIEGMRYGDILKTQSKIMDKIMEMKNIDEIVNSFWREEKNINSSQTRLV